MRSDNYQTEYECLCGNKVVLVAANPETKVICVKDGRFMWFNKVVDLDLSKIKSCREQSNANQRMQKENP